jgi:hypothetical protein
MQLMRELGFTVELAGSNARLAEFAAERARLVAELAELDRDD